MNLETQSCDFLRCVLLVLFAGLQQVSMVQAERPDPPNIVMIISDDQYYKDFGFMGNEHVQTPHLDALAARSARFVNASVPTSVCSPSLATLLTGLYPHQSGLHFNHPPPGNAAFNNMTTREEYLRTRSRSFEIIQKLKTLPRELHKQRGYRSLQTGKFWEGHFRNAGFTTGMTLFEPAPGQLFGGNRTLASGILTAHGNGDWGLKIGRETMAPIAEFLDAKPPGPFLIWYAPFLPHQPHDSPQRFYDLYQNDPDLPAHRVPYYASISQFDETVGQLVHMVESRKLMQETLFVFVIDNGWEASTTPERSRPEEFAHTRKSKRSPFEPGLRTPILLRWDGVIPPSTISEPVSSIDIVPTLYHACRLAEEARLLPGISLLPAAMGEEKLNPHRPLFGEIYPGDASTLGHPERDIAYRWIRMDNLKLIVPHKHQQRSPWNSYVSRPALFDLHRDPHETTSLIDHPHYQNQKDQLAKLLDSWWNGTSTVPLP